MIWNGLRAGLRDVGLSRHDAAENAVAPRTDRDLPMSFVGIGMIVLIVGIISVPSLHMNILGRAAHHRFRLSVRDCVVAADGRDRFVVQSDLGHDHRDPAVHVPDLSSCIGWTGGGYYVTALSVGAIVCIAASNGGTTSQDFEDGLSRRQHAAAPADRHPVRRVRLRVGAGSDPARAQRRQDGLCANRAGRPGGAVHGSRANSLVHEHLKGAQSASDRKDYLSWQKTDDAGGPVGKYLVDPATGQAAWLVDPGNQRHVHPAARRLEGGKI